MDAVEALHPGAQHAWEIPEAAPPALGLPWL